MNPRNVLEQAKRYAAGAFQGPGNWNGLKLPFLYATNGEIICFLDARSDKPVWRQISRFHTAPALEALFTLNPKPAHDWLLNTPPDIITRLREYQRRCILAVGQAIMAGRRELLLAMATGSGKTLLTVAQIYRLLESKLARRILFLVDRMALLRPCASSTPSTRPETTSSPRNMRSIHSGSSARTLATMVLSIRRCCRTNSRPH